MKIKPLQAKHNNFSTRASHIYLNTANFGGIVQQENGKKNGGVMLENNN
jgi:hypothetical protein